MDCCGLLKAPEHRIIDVSDNNAAAASGEASEDSSGYEEEDSIHDLVYEGDKDKIEELVKRKAAVIEARDEYGFTALQVACMYGRADIVELLIKYHALEADAVEDVCKGDSKGATALHAAAYCDEVNVLRLLWPHAQKLYPTADIRDGKNLTPLHYAAGRGNLESVQFLVESGADVDVLDSFKCTPFHFAARCGSIKVMKFLMSKSSDGLEVVKRKNDDGLTALHYAAWNGHPKAVVWLISKGASVDETDAGRGNTPLHWACLNGSSEVIQALVKAKANIFAANKNRKLPMELTPCRTGQYSRSSSVKSIFTALRELKDFVLPKHSEDATSTLLHYASAYGREEDIEWVLLQIKNHIASNKQDKLKNLQSHVNSRDRKGRNPMHWAAVNGNENSVEALAKTEIDLFEEDSFSGETPLLLALAAERHLEFIKEDDINSAQSIHKVCIDKVKQDFIKWATSVKEELKKEEELVKKLDTIVSPIVKDKDKMEKFIDGMTPFYVALHKRQFKVAESIIKVYGMEDVVNNATTTSISGWTPLHYATLLNDKKIVSKLCREKFGKQLIANAEDKSKKTALQYASELRHIDIKKELLERQDVRSYVDGLYRDRQVYIDAANAILVGAALIAGVTFAGWLQSPLGNTKQEYPKHVGIRVFWVFNCLSFLFSISTVLAGAGAVLPTGNIYIATAVLSTRRRLLIAAFLLSLSIVFVVGAFIAAGFVVLPSLFKYQTNMMATTIIGGITCVLCLVWFLMPLHRTMPLKVRNIFHKAKAKEDVEPNREPDTNDLEYKRGESYEYNYPWNDGLDGISKSTAR